MLYHNSRRLSFTIVANNRKEGGSGMTLKKLILNSAIVLVFSLVVIFLTVNGTLPEVILPAFVILVVVSAVALVWGITASFRKQDSEEEKPHVHKSGAGKHPEKK